MDDILKLFLPIGDMPNGFKPWMKKSANQKDFNYATDTHAMVRVPSNKCKGKYLPDETVPFTLSSFFDFGLAPVPVFVTRSSIIKALVDFELEHVKVECQACEGSGEGIFEDESCNRCEGKGHEVDTKSPMIFPMNNAAIRLDNRLIAPFYLNKITGTMTLCGVQDCVLLADTDTESKLHFVVNDVEVLIMPLQRSFSEVEEAKIIDIEI